MNLATFNALRKYETTSWAVWHERGDCSVAYFRTNLPKLHGRAIFLGLNRSEAWPNHLVGSHMPNFHTAGCVGDQRLKRFVQDAKLGNLSFAFMTDLSGEIKSDSGSVSIDFTHATESLLEKVKCFESARNRFIVCFGEKTFENLRKGLDVRLGFVSTHPQNNTRRFATHVNGEIWNVFRVWHPANYGRLIEKSEIELPIQLAHIDQTMGAK